MKNQLKNSAIPPYIFGLRHFFLTMLMGILCYPVFGQMSETKTENKPMTNSLRTGTGEVISVRHLKLKSGINADEFNKWVMEYFNPTWEGLIPGVRSFIAKGDTRGNAIGEYAYLIIYDSLKTRDAYAPEEGKHADWFKEIFFSHFGYLYDELLEFVEAESFSKYSSWVVLR